MLKALETFTGYKDDDDEALATQPVYFGEPFVSEDLVLCRLED
jgi:hypothetical protein